MMLISVEQMVESLRDKVDHLGNVKIPLSMLESYLRLAYSCGKVDAMVEYRNELAKGL